VDEIFASGLNNLVFSFTLGARGLRCINNSAEDIRDAAVEMLDRLEGRCTSSQLEEAPRQRAIKDVLARHGVVMNCRFAQRFLERNGATLHP
jgi:hypothetical protein